MQLSLEVSKTTEYIHNAQLHDVDEPENILAHSFGGWLLYTRIWKEEQIYTTMLSHHLNCQWQNFEALGQREIAKFHIPV